MKEIYYDCAESGKIQIVDVCAVYCVCNVVIAKLDIVNGKLVAYNAEGVELEIYRYH